jgi:hypothetical protein
MFNPIRGCSVFVYFPRLRRGLFKLNPSGVLQRNLKECICVFPLAAPGVIQIKPLRGFAEKSLSENITGVLWKDVILKFV